MFGLIRRISNGVIPRPDRPWDDDPTSNAPHKPRKRRLSVSEQDDANSNRQIPASRAGYVGESATKRARGNASFNGAAIDEFGGWSVPQQKEAPDVGDEREPTPPPSSAVEPRQEQVPETQDVKEVTRGVKKVDLEDKGEKNEIHVDEEEDGEKVQEVEEEPAKDSEGGLNPEAVPLPDEDEVDELDEESEENHTTSNGEVGLGKTTTDTDENQDRLPSKAAVPDGRS